MNANKWDMMGKDLAAELAREHGQPVVFASDGQWGYARLLRQGETEAEAAADFERAGTPCEQIETIEADVYHHRDMGDGPRGDEIRQACQAAADRLNVPAANVEYHFIACEGVGWPADGPAALADLLVRSWRARHRTG